MWDNDDKDLSIWEVIKELIPIAITIVLLPINILGALFSFGEGLTKSHKKYRKRR